MTFSSVSNNQTPIKTFALINSCLPQEVTADRRSDTNEILPPTILDAPRVTIRKKILQNPISFQEAWQADATAPSQLPLD